MSVVELALCRSGDVYARKQRGRIQEGCASAALCMFVVLSMLPHLSDADRALAADPDPAAPLHISAFKGLGLESAGAFVASFERYRAQIAGQGTLATLEAMNREG